MQKQRVIRLICTVSGFAVLLVLLAITADFMNRFSQLTNKRKDSTRMSLFISHRGESFDAPENTLAAYRLSNERDADGMECDVHLTADKVLVCGHDFSTQRMSGVDRIIEETPFVELELLDVSGRHEAYKDEKIPRFSDSLKTLKPGRKYFVEIKANDPAVVAAVRKDIVESGVPFEQIKIISFQADMIAESKKVIPEVPAYWLAHYRIREDGTPNYTPDEIFVTLERINADGLDVGGPNELLTPEFLAEVKTRGYYLAVWTIDDEERCRYFEANGVDAITSNKAAAMKAALHGK